MSVSHIPERVKLRLWAKSSGRCEYDGCNQPLYMDNLTKAEFNTSYIAHIIADKPNGPRGDKALSELLKADISNLMLLCDVHHRLIDIADVIGHPVNLLKEMKNKHENRIELVTQIAPQKNSHIVLYGTNIGQHGSPLCDLEAKNAIIPEFYPADSRSIELNLKNSLIQDSEDSFWSLQSENLEVQFDRKVKQTISEDKRSHFSVFGLAPQPLLIKLGTLISDIVPVEVYQLHREPTTWKWLACEEELHFKLIKPVKKLTLIALVVSLSGSINIERVKDALGEDVSVWELTIPNPNNDFIKSRDHLMQFRKIARTTLNEIKKYHGEKGEINIFPAMAASTSIELGRIWMPKADLPMIIYDQNSKKGGFMKTVKISS